MKQVSVISKNKVSKGDRLGWTPLKKIKSIPLSLATTTGKLLTSNDLSPNSVVTNSKNLLVR
jgi:hypothetical protein